MLYTLIGNGNANRKEVVETLKSLKSAVELQDLGDEFWIMFTQPDTYQDALSDAHSDVVQWAVKNNVPFEYVYCEPDFFPEWAETADEVHFVKNVLPSSMKLTLARPHEDEERAVLVLSDDIDSDDNLLAAVEFCISKDIPVYDLGNQMIRLTFEEVEETDARVEEGEQEDDMEFTQEMLMELNIVELRSLVNARRIIPRDMRSKDSLIEALLGNSEEPIAIEQEPATVPSVQNTDIEKVFYLTVIDADGSAEMLPLTAKQAQLVYKS
jgi:hypothetical protein